ncbi:ABC transporter ATP-binding protein [Corynebacterium propinquum]|uniref:ABC transporter ATP-binding protein n=1 Tax=Corynebacterium propinquum TaxID=43769 RepID=UPI00266EA8F2|nr:ABC transporter ATP-binding protein [Corynebacterium propinquum]WKS28642.1 energy-coupling factor ABC transporter ATP-binding protein [Corynebacterium propinquum]
MPATAVEISNYTWTHGGRAEPAVDKLNLRIPAGERVLICGDSGSGKSTLMSAIAGVLAGDEEGDQTGSLKLSDDSGTREAADSMIPVGLVLQDPDSQVIASRVGDDVAFGCENLGLERTEIWRRVREALPLVGLDLPLDHPTAQLSGGQKQRLALAGVIAMRPGIIILDEPTANLDPQGAHDVVAAVANVVEHTGATLLVVEHNYEVWEDVLERGLEFASGRLVDDAPAREIIARRRISGLPRAQIKLATNCAALTAESVTAAEQPTHLPPRSLELPAHASTVITGENGAGKTTLLMALAGLRPLASGSIKFSESIRDGLRGPVAKWKSRQLAQRIGYVFQNPEHQFVARTVLEELHVGPKVMGIKVGSERTDELLERLSLAHLAQANPFTLSGGEKRRLSVATALIAAPQLLLFDEPTFGQDPHTFGELVSIVRGLVDDGVTVVSVTHDKHYRAALGDNHVELLLAGGQ